MLNNHTRAVALALGVFVLLALAQTWPLAAAPSHWSRTDPGDGALNIWIVNWVAHMLAHPSRLFDANIFYPEKLTLAYSEAMIVQGVVAWPIVVLGGSPVLAYNVSLLCGLALTGWAFCLLVRKWTGSWSAGYVAGSLAAFNAFSLAHMTHLQFQHLEFLALVLFALDRIVASPRWKYVVTLAVAVAGQALTSIYLLVFTTWLVTFALVSRAREWWRRGRVLAGVAAAAALAALLLSPYLAQYWRLHRQMGFARGAAESAALSWANFLATTARVHYGWWSERFVRASTATTFPGMIASALAAVACWHRQNVSDPRFRMCVAAALGCIAVAAAPLLPFYQTLHDAIPLFQIARQLADIAPVILLMVAVIAGFGVASLQRSWPVPRLWPAVAFVLVLGVNLEATRAPMGFVWFEGVPAVYDVLAKEPAAVIVEMPFPLPQQWFLNTPYMVNATRHWRPMLNGYSGFRPPSYSAHYDLMRKFPSDEALIALLNEGVTHVVVHQRAMNQGGDDPRDNPFQNVGSLQLIARDEDVLIYRLRGR